MEIFVKQYGGKECRDKLRLRGIFFSFITVVTYPMQVYTNNENVQSSSGWDVYLLKDLSR